MTGPGKARRGLVRVHRPRMVPPFAMALSLMLAACARPMAVAEVPVWEPQRVPPGEAAAALFLDAIHVAPAPAERPIGTATAAGCSSGPSHGLAADEDGGPVIAVATFRPGFDSVMRRVGIPLVADPETGVMEAGSLRVRAEILVMALELCRASLLGSSARHRVSGAAVLTVCWTIDSPSHGAPSHGSPSQGRSVYAVETRGFGREDRPLAYGADAIARRAFAAAATNLAADPGFRALVQAAGAPPRLFNGAPVPLPADGGPGCRDTARSASNPPSASPHSPVGLVRG